MFAVSAYIYATHNFVQETCIFLAGPSWAGSGPRAGGCPLLPYAYYCLIDDTLNTSVWNLVHSIFVIFTFQVIICSSFFFKTLVDVTGILTWSDAVECLTDSFGKWYSVVTLTVFKCYHIHDLRCIRLYLPISATKTIDTALDSSKLDYSLVHLFQNTLRPKKNCNRIIFNGFAFSNYLKSTYTKSAKIESAIAA